MLEEGGKIGNNNSHDIQNDKVRYPKTLEYLLKVEFNVPPKKVKRKHVEKQVCEILVNKSGCYKPVIFASCGNEIRIHNHATYSYRIIERKKTD